MFNLSEKYYTTELIYILLSLPELYNKALNDYNVPSSYQSCSAYYISIFYI